MAAVWLAQVNAQAGPEFKASSITKIQGGDDLQNAWRYLLKWERLDAGPTWVSWLLNRVACSTCSAFVHGVANVGGIQSSYSRRHENQLGGPQCKPCLSYVSRVGLQLLACHALENS